MFERPDSGERAILVHIEIYQQSPPSLDEFRELAISAGVEVVGCLTGKRSAPSPSLYMGEGKAEELLALIQMNEADVVLFNHSLSPAQQRNLEKKLGLRVIDRTGLILDIFAQRASSFEGKLQVELAQLQHLSTRLIRGWTHLERQKGGIGLRGPGETQLETDRRLIGQRIRQITAKIEKVRGQRRQGRRARKRAELPSLSLVGYTNAGKSTLFNRLTDSGVLAANQLFATLDPTLRRIEIDRLGGVIVADTVGFIQDLPHDLVVAFRATLEEAREADLLLHVIDINNPHYRQHMDNVQEVLMEIDAQDVPQLLVYNKIDQLQDSEARIERDEDGMPCKVWLSAVTGAGLDLLKQAIAELLVTNRSHHTVKIPASAGRLRARLYEMRAVRNEALDENGSWLLEVEMQKPRLEHLCRDEGLDDCVLQAQG